MLKLINRLIDDVKTSAKLGEAEGAYKQQNYKKSFELYMWCAEKGDSIAQYCVATQLHNGLGVGKDAEGAFAWAKKSADQGYEVAQYNVGCCYRDGDGVLKDISKAKEYLTLAADQGHKKAAYILETLQEK
ncbi:MAG TPA: sel1 repeat family protein [Gammaproteobacteria bacterium]|nr:sel1 repeat family protein [Gammaproteobacteria bacterium]